MEELVDVLNEKGMYTGETQTREICSKKGLWHKAVCVFIINSKNQVLLQKRSANKKTWPNMWDVTAGGNVLAGEFDFQAIIRECKEELGIEFHIASKEIDITKLQLQEEEVSEVRWIDKKEIIEKIKDKHNGITDKEGCWEYLIKYYEMSDKNT